MIDTPIMIDTPELPTLHFYNGFTSQSWLNDGFDTMHFFESKQRLLFAHREGAKIMI